jgi:hypothetical protein
METNSDFEQGMLVEKGTSALKALLTREINSETDFEVWKSAIVSILIRIYGAECEQIRQVRGIRFRTEPLILKPSGIYGGENNHEECKNMILGLLNNYIKELELFGPPTTTKLNADKDIYLTVNQNQHVSIEVY